MPDSNLAAYVGVQSPVVRSELPVEPGAVRRFAQAVMSEDPVYWTETPENELYGGPIAPPLFPTFMFGRPFGSADPIQQHAHDPDYDGLDFSRLLPVIEPLRGYSMLNGGSEIDFFSFVRHGEYVWRQARYVAIEQRDTRRGPMTFVTTQTNYQATAQRPLLSVRTTLIWRAP